MGDRVSERGSSVAWLSAQGTVLCLKRLESGMIVLSVDCDHEVPYVST